MDKTETAFGPLHLRAFASDAAGPLDRISVRDYVCRAEIGAFASERGVTQRLRFNVVLEVAHHAAARDDDVDQVVSYDMIIKAIERLLTDERVDLLETLAERLAQACLADPRVLRAFIRVEKLDRIPGALGVEIVRSRIGPETPRLHGERKILTSSQPAEASVDVIFLGPEALRHGASWLSAIADRGHPAITCLGSSGQVPVAGTANARRQGYLMIELEALALADLDERFEVVTSRTEMEWALDAGVWPIWAPARMAEAALSRDVPDAKEPVALAEWLCSFVAGRLLIADGEARNRNGEVVKLDPTRPAGLAAL